jgi:hypothetical protein
VRPARQIKEAAKQLARKRDASQRAPRPTSGELGQAAREAAGGGGEPGCGRETPRETAADGGTGGSYGGDPRSGRNPGLCGEATSGSTAGMREASQATRLRRPGRAAR